LKENQNSQNKISSYPKSTINKNDNEKMVLKNNPINTINKQTDDIVSSKNRVKSQILPSNNKPVKSLHLNQTEKEMFISALEIGQMNNIFTRSLNLLSVESLYGIINLIKKLSYLLKTKLIKMMKNSIKNFLIC